MTEEDQAQDLSVDNQRRYPRDHDECKFIADKEAEFPWDFRTNPRASSIHFYPPPSPAPTTPSPKPSLHHDLVCEFAPCPLASPANPEDPEDLLEGAQTSSMTVSFTPGAGFDPRSRVFSPEELKPHPIVKKRGKVFVPNEKKDNLYWTRRLKNNVAAKRSREARRLKENQIALRAAFLERENTDLRVTVAELSRKNQVAVAEVRRLAQRLKMLEENEVRYQRRLLA